MEIRNQKPEISSQQSVDSSQHKSTGYWLLATSHWPLSFWFLALVTSLLALILGYYLSLDPTWLRIGFEPSRASHVFGLFAGIAGMLAILKWPEVGLLMLVAVLYTNLSEIGVRNYHWPSLLQLMLPLLALAILGRRLMSGRQKLIGDSLVVLIILYGAIIFLSSVRAINPELADESLYEHLKSLCIFLVIINLTTSQFMLRRAAWVLVLVGALLGTISVYQVFTSSYGMEFGGFGRIKLAQIVGHARQPRIAGPLSDPNFYAQILVPLVPLALCRLWNESSLRLKLLATYALGVIILTLVFTYSRGGALALGVVLLLVAIDKNVKLKYLFLGLIILAPLWLFIPKEFEGRLSTLNQLIPGRNQSIVHTDTSFQERTMLMRTAWEMFVDHPILGVGAGNYSEQYYKEYAQRVGSIISSYEDFGQPRFPHSLYLEIAAGTGLVGLIIFGAIIVVTLLSARSAVRLFKKIGDPRSANIVTSLALGFVGYLTSSLFLHGDYMRYFWLLVALIAAAKHIANQSGQQQVVSSKHELLTTDF
jgi:O-antigen ligase